MSSALHLKAYGIVWLKSRKNCYYIATECGRWSCDVLGSNEKDLFEIEVKISKSDLKADLKKHKHYVYAKYPDDFTPTSFYYLTPVEMKDFALKFIEENKLPYGLIVVEQKQVNAGFDRVMLDHMSVAKRPKRMHKLPTNKRVLREIQSRQLNEYIAHYLFPKVNGWHLLKDKLD